MGDVTVHAEIGRLVTARLRIARPRSEEYQYVMLGNYLTDMSQFRDPYSFQTAKDTVRREARAKLPVPILSQLPVAVVQRWADRLLGTPRGPDSSLSKFFLHLARAMTHQINTLKRPTQDGPLFPPGELDRILDASLTQYFPHEHLDWPPYSEGPDARFQPLYSLRKKALVGWIDEQVQYLSEELTKLEVDWLTAAANSRMAQREGHDVLVRLGHLLHAVEDFFFHSNFIEIAWFATKGDSLPGASSTGGDVSQARLQRKAARRRRYPIFLTRPQRMTPSTVTPTSNANEFVPSRTRSLDCSGTIITGGFGATDMMFTIELALEGLERAVAGLAQTAAQARQASPFLPDVLASTIGKLGDTLSNLHDSPLVLVRLAFNEDARRQLVAGGDRAMDAALATHRSQLLKGNKSKSAYDTAIESALQKRTISDAVAKELKSAFQVDAELEQGSNAMLHGVGGFLVRLLANAQKEVDRSADASRAMDGPNPPYPADASYDGVSDENIGSHSLLSKDGRKKAPFFDEAKALATHASSSVAVLLARRISDDPDPANGLDWDSILRHFLRFPRTDTSAWENVVLASIQNGGSQPELDAVADAPKFQKLGPSFGADKLQQRRAGKKRDDLEERYRGLESYADNPSRPRQAVPNKDDPT